MTRAAKDDIIALLEEIAALLGFRGENPFKVRAFENAARALGAEAASLDELLGQPGRLESVKGIGKSIAGVIAEAATSGSSPMLEQLRSETPAGITQMMRIPNLGPKKIRTLFEKLGVSDIRELEDACNAGRVGGLPGFGDKSVGRILQGIAQVRRFSGQWLLPAGEAAAVPLLKGLRECPAVLEARIAGSLRRRREIIRDIDLLVASAGPQEVMDHFITLPGISQVIAFGPTKTSVMLSNGMQADLRVVPPEEFAPALHYFTGSKEHNTLIRGRAKHMGLRVNEYGVFRGTTDDESPATDPRRGIRVPVASEADLFRTLGLDYVEPELREGLGEIEAAENGALPGLITLDDYRGVLHCHSTWSDGEASIREMALAARDVWGLQYLAICDHSEAAAYAGGVKRGDLVRQHDEIETLNGEFASSGFRILKGCECDILADGSLDYPDEYLERMDIVVASIHSRFQMGADEMTRRLVRAVEHPLTTLLGHPSGRLLLSREPYGFDVEAVLRRAGETGTTIEINGDPQRLDLDWRLCRRAKELGVRFTVNPDAHSVAGLGHIVNGINTARKGWLEPGDVLNCLPLDDFLDQVRLIRQAKTR